MIKSANYVGALSPSFSGSSVDLYLKCSHYTWKLLGTAGRLLWLELILFTLFYLVVILVALELLRLTVFVVARLNAVSA